jgi:hypothetical protein
METADLDIFAETLVLSERRRNGLAASTGTVRGEVTHVGVAP